MRAAPGTLLLVGSESSTASERREKKRQKVYKGRCGEDVRKRIGVNRWRKLPVDANQAETQLRDFMKLLLLSVVVVKAEQVRQIADRWTIQRNVRVMRVRYRIVQIVAAAVG